MNHQPIAIFWYRRDLRLSDNAGLYHALQSGLPVLPIFIFDVDILNDLPHQDARVEFIQLKINELNEELKKNGSSVLVKHGKPVEVWEQILKDFNVQAVFANSDYEPYAITRDNAVKQLLASRGIAFKTFKDHVIFEKDEIVKDDGNPYTVFTPYAKKWWAKLNAKTANSSNEKGELTMGSYYLKSYPTEKYADKLLKINPLRVPSLQDIGFSPAGIDFPPAQVAQSLIRNYDKTRNFPAIGGTSRLGIHFRFGTISIREKARKALQLNTTFLNELIWRDFYSQILWHFPQVVSHAFKPAYEKVPWRNAPEDFERWKNGSTGYPIVDAGMRELSTTGYMHNRVRMITASFLTKHLLIDWRWGEAYFAEKLLDFDLASNSGGWQWAAGCGTDAAPYFRIFNPLEQAKKFDPDWKYIKKWVPEVLSPAYPKPMVEHSFARNRCLEAFRTALSGGE